MNPIEERVSLHYDPRVGLALLVLQRASGRSLALTGDTLLDAAEAVLVEALAPEPKEEAEPVVPVPPVNPLGTALGYTCVKCNLWVPYNGFHLCQGTTIPQASFCTICGAWYTYPHACWTYTRPFVTSGTTSSPGPLNSAGYAAAINNASDALGKIGSTFCFGCG